MIDYEQLQPNEFAHPLVRDLCWTLAPQYDLVQQLPTFPPFSPFDEGAPVIRWLRELDTDTAQLEAFMAQSPPRLGLYFERLVLFYLQFGPHNLWELLDHNLVIFGTDASNHKVTLGELDFLLREGDTQVHLETAVKFYLGVARGAEVYWLGPNLRDRFDRKLQHLRDHQLPLSHRLRLEALHQRFWVKGLLFHPWPNMLPLHPNWQTTSSPAFWLSEDRFTDYCADEPGLWSWLPKVRWLAGRAGDEGVASCSSFDMRARLRHRFEQEAQPVMLRRECDGQRLMVVPRDWKERALESLNPSPNVHL